MPFQVVGLFVVFRVLFRQFAFQPLLTGIIDTTASRRPNF